MRRPGGLVPRTGLAAFALIIALAAPVCGAQAGACRPAVPLPQPTQPANLGVLKLQLLEYKCLGGYERDFASVIAEAKAYVGQRAGAVARPALVLDIDETSLSNWPQIEADDFGFIPGGACELKPGQPCGFDEWVLKGAAPKLGPTLDLFNAAVADRVSVFFISGRDAEAQQAVTVRNLADVGYKGWADVLLRPRAIYRTVAEFKTAERRRLSEQGYTIIANVGDQQSDLDGGYAERTFRVPNPFYYIP